MSDILKTGREPPFKNMLIVQIRKILSFQPFSEVMTLLMSENFCFIRGLLYKFLSWHISGDISNEHFDIFSIIVLRTFWPTTINCDVYSDLKKISLAKNCVWRKWYAGMKISHWVPTQGSTSWIQCFNPSKSVKVSNGNVPAFVPLLLHWPVSVGTRQQ